MCLAILFAELSWRTYEKWAHRWLKRKVPVPAELLSGNVLSPEIVSPHDCRLKDCPLK